MCALQAPSRPASLAAGIATLQELVAPLLNTELNARCTAVFIVTPAYRAPAKGSEDLGTWREFTAKQTAGYLAYQKALAAALEHPPSASVGPSSGAAEAGAAGRVRLANLNAAFEIVHDENEELWRDLFFHDDYHPSSLGSFLEVSGWVVVLTVGACTASAALLSALPLSSHAHTIKRCKDKRTYLFFVIFVLNLFL